MSDFYTINAVESLSPIKIFGDPRVFDRFNEENIQTGDFVAIELIDSDSAFTRKIGAVYFLRTANGQIPETVFDGEVYMTHMLLRVIDSQSCLQIIQKLVGPDLIVEFCEGKEMDGVHIPFYILKK